MDHGSFQVPCFRTAAAVISCVLVSTEPAVLSMHLPRNGMERFKEPILLPVCTPFKCRAVSFAGAWCHSMRGGPW